MIDQPPKRFYEFDQFRIDVEERRLLRSGCAVQLTPKVFDILITLVENNRRTVGKDKLMESVWADAVVEEGSLNRNVSTLRRVLGEDGHDPRFIKTVPKRGYRFEGDVHEIVEDNEEILVEKRTKFSLALRKDSGNSNPNTFPKSGMRIFLLIALAVLTALALVFAWTANRHPPSNARASVSSARSGGTTDPEAFELYQRGRDLWQNRTVDGLHMATQYLEQAVKRDPQFARAQAALADAYAFDVELWKKAESTANEAMRLDPDLGQPHATIGFVRMFWEWRFRDAEPYFKKAIDLSPEYATAHQWYALNLTVRKQGGGGLAEIKRAVELEPDSPAINSDLCQILYFARKYDQAIEQCQKTLRIAPDFLAAHQNLYEIYSASEMYPEAVAEYLKTEELNMTTPLYPGQLEGLKGAYADGGIRAFWQERIKILSKDNPPAAYLLAQYHTRLGHNEEALKWFERAAENHDFAFIFFTADPIRKELSGDPRYGNLVSIFDK